jgi:hypothetical protein
METAGNIAMVAATRIAASRSSAIAAAIYRPIAIDRPVAIPRSIAITISAAIVTIAGTTIIAMTIITSPVVATAIEAGSVEAVIPGPGADEHAPYKPVWPVVAIGCASIRIIAIVAVRAGRSRTVNRTDAHAHRDLGVRGSCGKKQNPQQCSIF